MDIVENFELFHDGNEGLFERCTKYSKISFLLKLYQIKYVCRISDKGITIILELLKDGFEYAKNS